MPISRDTALRLSRLARLELPASELNRISAQLSQIVEYAACLDTVNTDHLKLGVGLGCSAAELRKDRIRPSLPVEKALMGAPHSKGGFFLVPRVI